MGGNGSGSTDGASLDDLKRLQDLLNQLRKDL
jgi:hypothetical protein